MNALSVLQEASIFALIFMCLVMKSAILATSHEYFYFLLP